MNTKNTIGLFNRKKNANSLAEKDTEKNMNKRKYLAWNRMIGALALAWLAGPTILAATHSVSIGDNFFNPASLTINAGDTVTWVNQGFSTHNTRSTAGVWSSANLSRGQPFSFTFNDQGSFPYRCTIHSGQSGTITVQAAVNAPPSVSITSPTSGAIFTAPASVTITANATDSNGTVTQVEFFVDGASVGVDTSSPYSVTANKVSAGPHTLTATATDNAGAKTTSGAVNITVNAPNNPPSASVISPADGAVLQAPASLTLEATAADVGGSVSQVAFFRVINKGGPAVTRELLGTAATSPYRISLNNVQAGFYHLLAEATDNLGAKTDSREIVVTVYAPFRIISAVRSADGQVTLTVEGNAAMGPFTALASEDFVNWTNLPGTLLAQPDNNVQYVDTSAPDVARRFYRVRLDFQEPAPVSAGR